MTNAALAPTEDKKIIPFTIAGNWLHAGDLKVCLLKTHAPSLPTINGDVQREENIKILRALIEEQQGNPSELQNLSKGKPVLVLAAELAFCTGDFEQMKTWITNYPYQILLFASFGICNGAKLLALAQDACVVKGWNSTEVTPAYNYNCGWCWSKDRDGKVQCHIYLKNFLQQRVEAIQLDEVTEGSYIIRIDTDDLHIFPLICADIICEQNDSPRNRITSSFGDLADKKVLIVASLLEEKPFHGLWQTAFNHIFTQAIANSRNVALLIANGYECKPAQNYSDDNWRCLSGAFIARGSDKKSPKQKFVREIISASYRGLVLRRQELGFAFGKLRWELGVTVGDYILNISHLFLWKNDAVELCCADFNDTETAHLIRRDCAEIVRKFSDKTEIIRGTNNVLERLVGQLSNPTSGNEKLGDHLLRRTLHGIETSTQRASIDDLSEKEKENFAEGIVATSFVKLSLDAEICPQTVDHGQLQAKDKEILVWFTDKKTCQDLHARLAQDALNSRSATPLHVIAKGDGRFTSPEDDWITPGPKDDVGVIKQNLEKVRGKEVNDITLPRPRKIAWHGKAKFDDVVAGAGTVLELKKNMQAHMNLGQS